MAKNKKTDYTNPKPDVKDEEVVETEEVVKTEEVVETETEDDGLVNGHKSLNITEDDLVNEESTEKDEVVDDGGNTSLRDETKGRVTNCAALNLRETPSFDAEVLTLLKKNEPVSIIEDVDDEWVKIQSRKDITGYVYSKYIERG